MHAPQYPRRPSSKGRPHSRRPAVELLEPRCLLAGADAFAYWGLAHPAGAPETTQLVSIQADSGEVTWVGSPMSDALQDLVQIADGRLFGIHCGPGDRGLYAVNRLTGQSSPVADTPLWLGNALAYAPDTDTIYGLGKAAENDPSWQLAVFDYDTGSVSLVGPGSTLPGSDVGLEWDAAEQSLIVHDHSGGRVQVMRVDTSGQFANLSDLENPPASTSSGAMVDGSLAIKLTNQPPRTQLAFFDPVTGQHARETLLVSESFGHDGLDYGLIPASTPGFGGVATYAYIGIAVFQTPFYHRQLITIDPSSGQLTRIGDPITAPPNLHGIVMTGDGDLFAIDGSRGDLYRLDWETGQPILVGNLQSTLAHGLAYDADTDTLYALGKSEPSDPVFRLLVLDRTTATATPVGPGSADISWPTGLTWDRATGQLIVFDNTDDAFYGIDRQGNVTRMGVTDILIHSWGMAHNGQQVVIPLGASDPNEGLYFGRLDPDTGRQLNWSLRLSAPLNNFSALAFGPVPIAGGGAMQDAYVAISTSRYPHTNRQLVTIDPISGEVTWWGTPLAEDIQVDGLVVTNDGELYGIGGATGNFYSVDWSTGQLTLVGNSGFALAYGLAYNARTDTIYGVGKPAPADEVNTLLVFDRTTGVATAVGSGASGLTGTSGVAWDPVGQRVIVFDNADDQFVAFDAAGTATYLSTARNPLVTYGATYVDDQLVMPLAALYYDRLIGFFDAETGAANGELLWLSEPLDLEALEYPISHASTRLSGKVFRDFNANAVWDSGEPAVVGHEVYLDLNGNEAYDDMEPLTITTSDDPWTPEDETGEYRFQGLASGSYTVRQRLPRTLVQTLPDPAIGHVVSVSSDTMIDGLDFGNRSYLQNPLNRFDVNGDTFASPVDVLNVIAWLNSADQQIPDAGPMFLDVDGDSWIAPRDALALIYRLNHPEGEGEGEAEGEAVGGTVTVLATLPVQSEVLSVSGHAEQVDGHESEARSAFEHDGLLLPASKEMEVARHTRRVVHARRSIDLFDELVDLLARDIAGRSEPDEL